MLVAEPLVLVDYLVLVHPESLEDVPEWYRGPALLALAARVGTTRLIDNALLTIGRTPATERPPQPCASSASAASSDCAASGRSRPEARARSAVARARAR